MATQTRNGFTIIEVILFLAITGALTVGILIGSSAAIGQQRYRDSVNSFKGLLQEQYNQATNVVNGEVQNPACAISDEEVVFDDNTQRNRGTSDCLVLGRFVLIEPSQVTAFNVIGRSLDEGIDSNEGDSAVLSGYSFGARQPETHEVSWGARVVQPKSSNGLTASLLIVRSPLSGSILTYIQDGNHSLNLADMISDEYMVQKDFCMDSGGMSGMGRRLAVRINAKASNQGAVEIPLERDNICD